MASTVRLFHHGTNWGTFMSFIPIVLPVSSIIDPVRPVIKIQRANSSTLSATGVFNLSSVTAIFTFSIAKSSTAF